MTLLQRYGIANPAEHVSWSEGERPITSPRYEREDYMRYLCEHRTLVKEACGELAYKQWPVQRANVVGHSIEWQRFDETEVRAGRPECWSKQVACNSLVSECHTNVGYKTLDHVELAKWKLLTIPVIYATCSYDPLYQDWRLYVGQTKSLASRWNACATSTTRSHHNALWQIFKSVANARDDATPKDLLLSSFQLCDLAYAASIVDHAQRNLKYDEGGVWQFVCEELPMEAKTNKATRDLTEWQWCTKLEAFTRGYNVQSIIGK